MISRPTEAELSKRIKAQIAWRGATSNVALIWRGYLAGLYEWGQIDLGVYGRCVDLLPKAGLFEIDEIFSGEPISREREAEIRKHNNI